MYSKTRVITKQPSINVAVKSIYQLYEQQNTLQEMHLDHQSYLNTEYWNQFETVMRNDLCPEVKYFKNTSISCDKFISGSLNQGLHVVIVRYFETLRNMLNTYQNHTQFSNTTAIS